MHLAKELIRNVQYSGCSRNFAKEIRALEMRSSVASYQKLTNDQLRGSLKPNLLKLHKKLLKSSALAILWSFSIWSKLERWKSLVYWVSHKLIKKKSVFWSDSMQLQWTTSQLDCNVQWKVYCIWQLVMVGLRRSSNALPKAKLTRKNGHGHCLVVCCPSDPLQLSESGKTITSEQYAQQISEMHLKLHNAYS